MRARGQRRGMRPRLVLTQCWCPGGLDAGWVVTVCVLKTSVSHEPRPAPDSAAYIVAVERVLAGWLGNMVCKMNNYQQLPLAWERGTFR